jgi:glutathione peroxidase
MSFARQSRTTLHALITLAGLALVVAAAGGVFPAWAKEPVPMSLHNLSANTIEKKPQALGAYKDKVVLVVNTASECGFTPQYAGLQELYQSYKDKGLVVLGFPSNDFGGQEPGKDSEVLSFCQSRFGVTFPLFSKSVVKGSDASPVFKFLASGHGEPQWNFHKYLVDKKGVVVKAFPSKVEPGDPALIQAIEQALAAQ